MVIISHYFIFRLLVIWSMHQMLCGISDIFSRQIIWELSKTFLLRQFSSSRLQKCKTSKSAKKYTFEHIMAFYDTKSWLFGLSCFGISNKLAWRTKNSKNRNFRLIYWVYRVILGLYCDFCEFPRNQRSDKNEKHRNVRFSPVDRVYCAIFAFILRFSDFSRKKLSYKTRKYWKCVLTPFYRAYYVIYGLILRFSDFLCFGVWIRCSSRFKYIFLSSKKQSLVKPLAAPKPEEGSQKSDMQKNLFDGIYRVIWDDYTVRFRMAIQAWKMPWF